MTFHSCPSMLRTTPFLMSAVEAMGREDPFFWGLAGGTPTLHSRRREVIARSSGGGSDANAARRGSRVGGPRPLGRCRLRSRPLHGGCRSEARRVGTEVVSTCRYRSAPDH